MSEPATAKCSSCSSSGPRSGQIIKLALADPAYDSRESFNLLETLRIELGIKIKRGVSGKVRGNWAWRRVEYSGDFWACLSNTASQTKRILYYEMTILFGKNLVWEFIPYIVEGTKVTLSLVLGALAIGAIIGLLIALGEVYGDKKIWVLLKVYIWFFRGMPLIVLLFLFFYGVFPSLGFRLNAFSASILVVGFRSAAFQSEIFRGAIESVTGDQMMAARSLGMSKVRSIYHIILPQALRISLPGWSNEYAIILKDSAICFAIGVMEILTRTRYVAMATLEPFMPYVFAAILFIILTYGGTGLINWIYEKTKIPGLIRKV